MTRPTSEDLTIVWRGEIAPGVTFYGLRAADQQISDIFPQGLWPPSGEFKRMTLRGEAWEVVVWDIHLIEWPAPRDWRLTARETMEYVIRESGCEIAWIGREGYFCDPPDLFKSEYMSGGVIAAVTRGGWYRDPPDLDRPLSWLTADELGVLRSQSAGLSDAV